MTITRDHSKGRVLARRVELDGLRGFAIAAVVLHHVDPVVLPGGYVGVDIFLVVSGFLITSILLGELDNGDFSILRFFAKRVRRLLPAAVVMGAVVLMAGAAVLLPRDYKNLGGATAAYMAMLSNVALCMKDNYFDAQERQWPLLHTWSLALEEQFYLVYPAILILLRRHGVIVAGLLVFCAASYGWGVWRTLLLANDSYYLLPSRAWELLVGGLCAMAPNLRLRSRHEWPIGAVAATSILASMVSLDEATLFPGWVALIPVLCTATLILITGCESSVWQRVLSYWPATQLGLASYSVYLWHWPILVLARYPWSAAVDACPRWVSYAAGAASVIVGGLSYRFIETRFRSARVSDGKVLSWGAGASVALALAGSAIHRLEGLPDRLPPKARAMALAINIPHDRYSETMGLTAAAVRKGDEVLLGDVALTRSASFALWGDSHADALVPAFDTLAKRHGVVGLAFCRAATPPVPCMRFLARNGHAVDQEFAEAVLQRLTHSRIRYVVLAACWTGCLKGHVVDPTRASTATACLDADCDADALARGLKRTIAGLEANGVERIWLVRNVPEQRFHVPRQCALSYLYGAPLPVAMTPEEYAADAATTDRVLQSCRSETVEIIDLPETIFGAGNRLIDDNDHPLYRDSHHLSPQGSMWMMPAVERIFDEMLQD